MIASITESGTLPGGNRARSTGRGAKLTLMRMPSPTGCGGGALGSVGALLPAFPAFAPPGWCCRDSRRRRRLARPRLPRSRRLRRLTRVLLGVARIHLQRRPHGQHRLEAAVDLAVDHLVEEQVLGHRRQQQQLVEVRRQRQLGHLLVIALERRLGDRVGAWPVHHSSRSLDDALRVARADVEVRVLAQAVDQADQLVMRPFGELLVRAPERQQVELGVLGLDPVVGRELVLGARLRLRPAVAAAVARGRRIGLLVVAAGPAGVAARARLAPPGAAPPRFGIAPPLPSPPAAWLPRSLSSVSYTSLSVYSICVCMRATRASFSPVCRSMRPETTSSATRM